MFVVWRNAKLNNLLLGRFNNIYLYKSYNLNKLWQ